MQVIKKSNHYMSSHIDIDGAIGGGSVIRLAIP